MLKPVLLLLFLEAGRFRGKHWTRGLSHVTSQTSASPPVTLPHSELGEGGRRMSDGHGYCGVSLKKDQLWSLLVKKGVGIEPELPVLVNSISKE